MTPTQQIRQRPRNDAEDAMILVWILLAAAAGVVYYLAYSRFHLRPNQLVELTLYPTLVAYFLYECLRYAATRKSKLEEAWPRPNPAYLAGRRPQATGSRTRAGCHPAWL